MILTIRNFWTVLEGNVTARLFTRSLVLSICLYNIVLNLFCRCVQQINKANRGDLTPEELKERQV